MMYDNVLFWFLLIGHLTGDFYFQTKNMVAGKEAGKKSSMTLHILFYSLAVFVFLLPVISWYIIIILPIIAATHLTVDIFKIKIINHCKEKVGEIESKFIWIKKWIFVVDQILHIAIICIIASFYASNKLIAISCIGNFAIFIHNNLQIALSPKEFLQICFVFVFIIKPVSVWVTELKSPPENIEPPTNELLTNQSKKYRGGEIIGYLERVLVVIMMFTKNYSAIGLIFTAKSITRQKRFADEAFAEYYLIGSLLSILLAVLSVVIVKISI